ncbi:MAG: MaoC family dehydratase [Dehalococcoidales bacterium]|nr:MaoC family dehydratase [Dehalococcoidales bacterium]
MAHEIKISDLVKDFKFPPVIYSIDSGEVNAYTKAVEDNNAIYTNNGYIPPMAVAALAMTTMGEQMSLPSGSIHVSQEFTFSNIVRPGDNLTSQASVIRNIERGKIHMLTIGIDITNQQKQTVLHGETGFILPRA